MSYSYSERRKVIIKYQKEKKIVYRMTMNLSIIVKLHVCSFFLCPRNKIVIIFFNTALVKTTWHAGSFHPKGECKLGLVLGETRTRLLGRKDCPHLGKEHQPKTTKHEPYLE